MVDTIKLFLAPAIMISAGGLLCLAQFGRLNSILGMLRAVNRERIDLGVEKESGAVPELNRLRAAGLATQAEVILENASMVKNSLSFLVGGLMAMILCSLCAGGSALLPALAPVSVGIFIVGLLAMFVGLYLVLSELRLSLRAVEMEHERVTANAPPD